MWIPVISRADPCFCWGEPCFVSQFSMWWCVVVYRSLNSCQQERLGEENALPLGGIKFPAKAKLLLSSMGSNSFTKQWSWKGRGIMHRPHQLSPPEVGSSSLAETGGTGRAPTLGQRSPARVCCGEVERALQAQLELIRVLPPTSEPLGVFQHQGRLLLRCDTPAISVQLLLALSFAGSVPSRPADLPWAEMNSRNHTHTGFVSPTAHRRFWSGETKE